MIVLAVLLQPFIYIGIALSFLTLILPVSIVALPFSQYRRLKMTAPCWRLYFSLTLRWISLARITKFDYRDEQSKKALIPQGLYIANHQSFADIPLIFSTFIIPPIMKKSLVYIPIFGICCYASGAILVDRAKGSSRKKVFMIAARRLKEGFKHLQYYPEGTRSKDGIPRDFKNIKAALIRYAYNQKIPVFPISIAGTKDLVQHGLIIPGSKLGIIFHASLNPTEFSNEDEFARACWEQVKQGHKELTEIK
ncbi:MAG: hypothetical protein CME62_11845 [Halobacteriovoraceae bacterium]|nr:hypothetical protein [Halobacteriovoraceae bacterium]|tara:strand:- start:5030 stop:5782 length:753 start_codon:yes stop_codon:yes gene_type:complete